MNVAIVDAQKGEGCPRSSWGEGGGGGRLAPNKGTRDLVGMMVRDRCSPGSGKR